MADGWNRQEALARFFMEHRLERTQLRPGQRVVVFVTSGRTAEIRAQGVFFGFRHEPLGECIVLGTIPDEETEDTFPEPLAHIQRMSSSGFVLPPHLMERRAEEPERRSILLEAGFMFANGDAYAQLNAILNIPRPKVD